MVFATSCKKEEERDSRDQFAGTYYGTQTVTVPELEISETASGTMNITKSSEKFKILFNDGTVTQKASVNGNRYDYEKYTQTEIIEGTKVTIEISGSGTFINGKPC